MTTGKKEAVHGYVRPSADLIDEALGYVVTARDTRNTDGALSAFLDKVMAKGVRASTALDAWNRALALDGDVPPEPTVLPNGRVVLPEWAGVVDLNELLENPPKRDVLVE